MITALAARLGTSRGARTAGAAGAIAALALLALSGGGLAPAAARAGLVAAVLFAATALVRRKSMPGAPAPSLGVVARTAVAPGASVAIVEADGRRFLVGAGKDGVRILARLTAAPASREPPPESRAGHRSGGGAGGGGGSRHPSSALGAPRPDGERP